MIITIKKSKTSITPFSFLWYYFMTMTKNLINHLSLTNGKDGNGKESNIFKFS